MINPGSTEPADQPSALPGAVAAAVPRLEVVGMSKRFPGVHALCDVHLQVMAGEVLAVIGENGAGKSTLMKILAGVQPPDQGDIRVDGAEVRFGSPADAMAAGVSLIHQELNLAENLTVAENVYLGREPRRCGFVARREMHRRAAEYLAQVGLDVDPALPLSQLSLAGQQLVEIAKALSTDARVVIMDEPTSSLSARETQRLLDVAGRLRAGGVSVVYISHRLGEVQQLADRVEVLRDGRNAGMLRRDAITHDAMVRRMVGRDLEQFFPRQSQASPGDVRLQARRLVVATAARQTIEFQVRGGEVVTLAGLVGAGRSELVETLFGIRPALGGEVIVDGRPLRGHSPRAAMTAGVALVPEDRKASGLLLEMSVRENLTIAALPDAPAAPWISRGWERSVAAGAIAQLGVRTADQDTSVANLSGGNQQKVALGKWLLRSPSVLILDEPTRGVDIGARHEIYEIIKRMAAGGVAVLLVSSDMEEVLGMSDRVLVMHEGALAGELTREQLSEAAVMRLAVGGDPTPVVGDLGGLRPPQAAGGQRTCD